jgi:hypothetical protein
MNKILTEISWFFDYNVAYFLTNGNKQHRYQKYMEQKWGTRFTSRR